MILVFIFPSRGAALLLERVGVVSFFFCELRGGVVELLREPSVVRLRGELSAELSRHFLPSGPVSGLYNHTYVS